MKNAKVYFSLAGLMTLLSGNAFATSSSQILVSSKLIYNIGTDMTSGMWPTALILIGIGVWGVMNVFGKGLGDGMHWLVNIIATGAILIGAGTMLTNAGLFSCSF